MPGGEFLLVGYRCWFRDGVAEHNAVVIGPDGTQRRSGSLGDGIQDIHTPTDRIIVGYFDEGVFGGNYGWAGAQGGMPIGVSGLVEFDTELDLVWSYPPSWKKSVSSDGPVLPPIADAYTLNVVHAADPEAPGLPLTGPSSRRHGTREHSQTTIAYHISAAKRANLAKPSISLSEKRGTSGVARDPEAVFMSGTR